jgi:subtilase family serine protease
LTHERAGVSLLAATQDEGAPSSLNAGCTNMTHPIFAIYPASSPFITAISGTTLTPASNTDQHQARHVEQSSPPICNQGMPCISTPVTEWPCMTNNT